MRVLRTVILNSALALTGMGMFFIALMMLGQVISTQERYADEMRYECRARAETYNERMACR